LVEIEPREIRGRWNKREGERWPGKIHKYINRLDDQAREAERKRDRVLEFKKRKKET
jgi:hypothetical protein